MVVTKRPKILLLKIFLNNWPTVITIIRASKNIMKARLEIICEITLEIVLRHPSKSLNSDKPFYHLKFIKVVVGLTPFIHAELKGDY